MLFTAQPIAADRALRLGMINHVVPAGEIEAFTLSLAETMAANAPLSISVMKEELRLLASAHSITPLMFEQVQGLRRKAYDSEDYEEGQRALSERRKPVFKGA
jgi:methylmalonyl-CoA decarboxylase